MINKILFSCKQSWKLFFADQRRYYLVIMELILAIALTNFLFSIIYSAHITQVKFKKANLYNSIEVEPQLIKKVYEAYKYGLRGPIIPFTLKDIEDIQSIFIDKADILLFKQASLYLRKGDQRERVQLCFSNMLQAGEYSLIGLTGDFVSDKKYELLSISDYNELYEKILYNIRNNKWNKNISITKNNINIFKVLEGFVDISNVVLLPISLWIEDQKSSGRLIISFKDDYYSKGVLETIKLLSERHGDDVLRYSVKFGIGNHNHMVLIDIKQLVIALTLFTAGFILILILALSGVITSIIKKRKRDISIRLCIGISLHYVYWETLFFVVLISAFAGIVGLCASIPIITNIDEVFDLTLQYSPWVSVVSFFLTFFVGVIASITPLMNLKKVEPIQTLKIEN